MLKNSKEIDIMMAAGEPGLRLATRSEQGPREIVRDFMGDRRFEGKRVLELGPGHFEFCELVRTLGGNAFAYEFDPAVVRLGKLRGFDVKQLDFRELVSFKTTDCYDGLFCKGSSNPFWFYNDTLALESYIDGVTRLVTAEGWVWFVSCPWKPGVSDDEFAQWLDVEEGAFRSRGYGVWNVPSRPIASFYGISMPCKALRVYTLRLPPKTFGAMAFCSLLRLTAARGIAKVMGAG